jgi:hypothetical protein
MLGELCQMNMMDQVSLTTMDGDYILWASDEEDGEEVE